MTICLMCYVFAVFRNPDTDPYLFQPNVTVLLSRKFYYIVHSIENFVTYNADEEDETF
jgi:hypothetical protein